MLHLVRALHVFGRIGPLAAGEEAAAAAALTRALSGSGEQITVVTRLPDEAEEADLARLGFARRLDPLLLPSRDGARLTLLEGRLAGGAVPIVAVEGLADGDDESLAAAALELATRRGGWPDVVRATADTPHLIPLAAERAAAAGHAAPGSVLLLSSTAEPVTTALCDAVAAAHRVVVPSSRFAAEIFEHGEGALVEMLRAAPDRVRGVPPGIDEPRWNPARDPHLGAPLEPTRLGKAELKRVVRRELGFAPGAAPLLVVLGPLELLDADAAEGVALAGAQVVFVDDSTEPGAHRPGSRRADHLALARDLVHRHPVRVRCVPADRSLLHRLVAAADLALHCHRPAPGGFSPLYGATYGAVPIAPRAGAFADAVVDWDAESETGTGFLYSPHRPEDIPAAVRRGVRATAGVDAWDRLVSRAVGMDLGWRTAGLRHAEVGREAMRAARAV